ncbi:MAG TPA: class I SAM-dependent methyltransferase [Stellaceae bacterium]|nr:class I SAM-dependent methyltransferase [Stellaceae bacterium]
MTIMVDRHFRIRDTCRACDSARLDRVLPLKPLPLVSPNLQTDDERAAKVEVPADLYLCAECGLLQLTAVIDPSFQYNQFKYVTTISLGLPEHFRRSAGDILAAAQSAESGRVLEIGSNDGTLLAAFQERGWKVQGIDPARGAVEQAIERGIPTIRGFFEPISARDIRNAGGSFDLVIANNTLANIDDLASVAEGLNTVLAPDGVFVFETSYGSDVVLKTLLDTIYHEHLSYFMVRPLASFFARHGLELFDVSRIGTKGGSIRGYVQHRGGTRTVKESVARMAAEEEAIGLYSRPAYDRMGHGLERIRTDLAGQLVQDHTRGKGIAAWGASVGCVTLINQLDLALRLSCVFDDQPLLDAIEGPGYRIPVVSPVEIDHNDPGVIVLLAWRYAEPIMGKLRPFCERGGRVVVPLPEVRQL